MEEKEYQKRRRRRWSCRKGRMEQRNGENGRIEIRGVRGGRGREGGKEKSQPEDRPTSPLRDKPWLFWSLLSTGCKLLPKGALQHLGSPTLELWTIKGNRHTAQLAITTPVPCPGCSAPDWKDTVVSSCNSGWPGASLGSSWTTCSLGPGELKATEKTDRGDSCYQEVALVQLLEQAWG